MSLEGCDVGPDARYGALVALVDLSAERSALPDVLIRFAEIVAPAVAFDDCVVLTPSTEDDSSRAFALCFSRDRHDVDREHLESIPVPGIDAGVSTDLTEPILVDDLVPDGPFPVLRAFLRGRGNRSACFLRGGAAPRSPVVLCLAARRPAAFTARDVGFLLTAARLFSMSWETDGDALESDHRSRPMEEDGGFWRTLLEVNNAVAGTVDPEALRTLIADGMRRLIAYDDINLFLFDEAGMRVEVFSLDPEVPRDVTSAVGSIRFGEAPFADPKALSAPVVFEPGQMTFMPDAIREEPRFRSMKRFCLLPLTTPRRLLGAIALSGRSEDAFPPDAVWRAAQAANQVAIALENALAFREIAVLKDRLAQENLYLEEEIRDRNEFEEIVGESKALQNVLAQVRSVADTDSTVLLLGETGTGKELLARAIHRLSSRRSRTLVAVNCAASPAGLLESEWFGYEKGAFTGALARKLGRFELADGGTLFLDEVGDIPLELQAKLLRVLQEREIERLGAARPVRVDFRLIGATNIDLRTKVDEKSFRGDLFYRLHVFPIRIPPLRERPDDIPPLVRYFTQRYAARLRRPIDSVPSETMEALRRWPWPGNVRELQNVIERAVILSPGRSLQIPDTEFSAPGPIGGTLESAEREHILRALLDTKWVVGGPNGAASRLGLKRTTLVSTMKRLGVERPGDQ